MKNCRLPGLLPENYGIFVGIEALSMGQKGSELAIRLILAVMRLFGRLPLKFHYLWGRMLSWIMEKVLHYRKDVVLINLARSFPGKDYKWVKQVCSAFYRHLGDVMAETIWFSAADYDRLKKSRICRYTNLEVLCRAYESSPSVTILYSHCGNWELLGGMWCYNYDPEVSYPSDENCVKVVYRRLRSHIWNEVFKRTRLHPIKIEGGYDGEIESGQILRYAIRNRDRKLIYIYPTDQFPYAVSHDVGLFMNQKTKVMLGSAGLAHRLGMSVLYMRMKPVSRGHYEITFVPICENAALMEPEAVMRKYFDLLEADIRETPHNWLWSHKRWKP